MVVQEQHRQDSQEHHGDPLQAAAIAALGYVGKQVVDLLI